MATAHPPRPDRSGTSALLGLAVVAAGLALAVTGVLPWAGISATFGVVNADLTSVHGTEDGAGWWVMGSGVVAAGLGALGISRSRLVTGLAILPGAVAAFSLAMFLTRPHGFDRLTMAIPGLVRVEPVILYGWWAGLGASVVLAALACLALMRRRPPDQS
ncbi:hypothetical protein [Herbidospora cretacea]|uniref:hypothetical protein n=1 Tax=Herbidospora cretacea TaxID=28444 RepID=UPI0004C435BE|nr:hypothetical protein [Herbidospora cretacea]